MDNWVIILIVGLLLFGRRLPEVGRSLGKGIVEFKKGLNGIEDEIENAGTVRPTNMSSVSQLPPAQSNAAGYKFDPYTGRPLTAQPPPAQPQMRFDPYTGKPLNQQETATAGQSNELGV
ncbi:MAG TPA: twin-arginine translocase TatA/TatE family subunit [Tepidisphaeraceae bacterium]|nr:twin-arginine translocase TatA/TatE family subunit [Tepidisphaeraceae bacterium]